MENLDWSTWLVDLFQVIYMIIVKLVEPFLV